MSEKTFWTNFYSSSVITETPSSFAKYVYESFEDLKNVSLLDVGCGNGRDSRYFSAGGFKVTGIDQAVSAVENNKNVSRNDETYIAGDFTSEEFLKTLGLFDLIYSRFTLHSVSKTNASAFLSHSFNMLNKGGILAIEVRSVNSDMYGKGERDKEDPDAWIFGHYRRFVRKEELSNELEKIGYKIIYNQEQSGWSKYKDDDPVLIRIIAQK